MFTLQIHFIPSLSCITSLSLSDYPHDLCLLPLAPPHSSLSNYPHDLCTLLPLLTPTPPHLTISMTYIPSLPLHHPLTPTQAR